jgi:hypothetical protein
MSMSMRKTFRLLPVAVLLLVYSAAQAQTQNLFPGEDKGAQDSAQIQGCLQRAEGNYILVDKETNTYQQLSNNKKLKALIGHEVRLTGTPSVRTIDTTPAGGASSATLQHYIQVKTVEDVAPNCQAR